MTPWTVALQAPLSVGLSRQECWSGLPFPAPGDLPNSGIEPRSPALQADSLLSELLDVLLFQFTLTSYKRLKYIHCHETCNGFGGEVYFTSSLMASFVT